MADIISITKVSGVTFIASGSQNPVSYIGLVGNYQFNDAGTNVTINIGNKTIVTAWGNLSINGQTPSTESEAKTLLNAIFGA